MPALLIIAPDTAALITAHGITSKFSDTMTLDAVAPEVIIRQLANHQNNGIDKVLIVERCLSELEENWIWVNDAINRSGANPLRGISGDWSDPFVDLTDLYHVPPDARSTTVICIGNRTVSATSTEPSCAHLHSLAILAHRVNIAAFGILVNPHSTAQFNPASINL